MAKPGLLSLAVLCLLLTSIAGGQSDREPNVVQVEVRSDPALAGLGRSLASRIERSWVTIHERLGLPVRKARLTLELVRDAEALRKRVGDRSGGHIETWAVGVALPFSDWLGLRQDPGLPYDLESLRRVLDHELVHVALAGLGEPGYEKLPRWMHEGLAQWCSGEAYVGEVLDLWVASRMDQLLPLRDLEDRFPVESSAASLAYQESASIVSFLANRTDDRAISRFLARIREGESFEESFVAAFGGSRVTLEEEWKTAVRKDASLLLRFLREHFFFVILALLSPLVLVGLVRRARRKRQLLRQWEQERSETDMEIQDLVEE